MIPTEGWSILWTALAVISLGLLLATPWVIIILKTNKEIDEEEED